MGIPAHFYFYWSGEGFSFLNHLSVHSLLRKTPGATCEVHFDVEPSSSNRHWSRLRNTPGVSLCRIDFPRLLQDAGADGSAWAQLGPAMIETHKSDLFRYLVLFSRGGVYADLDVLFLKDFSPLLRHDFFVGFQITTQYPRLLNTAVFGARPGLPVVETALGKVLGLLQEGRKLEWGDLGPDLMTNVLVKDCLRNRALVRCARRAHKLRLGRTIADDLLCRFVRKNHDVAILHRDCFYYRSWLAGEWEQIFDGTSPPANAYAVHLWHKESAGVMDAIDETNFRKKISNPALLALCENFMANHS